MDSFVVDSSPLSTQVLPSSRPQSSDDDIYQSQSQSQSQDDTIGQTPSSDAQSLTPDLKSLQHDAKNLPKKEHASYVFCKPHLASHSSRHISNRKRRRLPPLVLDPCARSAFGLATASPAPPPAHTNDTPLTSTNYLRRLSLPVITNVLNAAQKKLNTANNIDSQSYDSYHFEKLTCHGRIIKELKLLLGSFQRVEEERDMALKDSHQWKQRYQDLNEGIQLLTQEISSPTVSIFPTVTAVTDGDTSSSPRILWKDESNKFQPYLKQNIILEEDKMEKVLTPFNQSISTSYRHLPHKDPSRDSSLLDVTLQEEDENQHTETRQESRDVRDFLHIPGCNFATLFNTCQQQKQLFQVATKETAKAIETLEISHANLITFKERMGEAEEQLSKLREENCSVQQASKKKQEEMQSLERKVKELHQKLIAEKIQQEERDQLKTLKKQQQQLQLKLQNNMLPQTGHNTSRAVLEDTPTTIARKNQRLMEEFEEHVVSTIRLHERFLVATGESSAVAEFRLLSPEVKDFLNGCIDEDNMSAPSIVSNGHLSEKGRGIEKFIVDAGTANHADPFLQDTNNMKSQSQQLSLFGISRLSTIQRENTVWKLHDGDHQEEDRNDGNALQLLGEDGSNRTRMDIRDSVPDDIPNVIDARADRDDVDTREVYHLKFNSQRIGIHFQKVPSKRLLLTNITPAQNENCLMIDPTSKKDTEGGEDYSNTFSPAASIGTSTTDDLVLVCGFDGFDDSEVDRRPKIGAQLVAFDGISIETGWAFDSIRKSIESRGRPLTLSFRNDIQTTEQQAVLAEAVVDVAISENQSIEVYPPLGYIDAPSVAPSIVSVLSNETVYFIDDQRGGIHGTESSEEEIHDDENSFCVSKGSIDNSPRRPLPPNTLPPAAYLDVGKLGTLLASET